MGRSAASGQIRFDGEVAIVTGAGHGLGRAYACELAARGAAVVCNDVVAARAHEVAREILQQSGSAIAETSSVATPAGGVAIVEAALDAFGGVDVVVNNAGQLRNRAFEDMTVEDFTSVLDTHLAGAFHVTQPAYRRMAAAGGGRVVFTSSSAGMFGSPWQASYAAAKAGIVGLCNVVAIEGARHGIVANALMPMALTGIGESASEPHFAPDDLEETLLALRPLAPSMTVENVTPMVVYLASRQCTETGQVFSVGCGHVAQVFVGTTRGWWASGPDAMTPETIAEQMDAVRDLSDFAVPASMNDEARYITANRPARADGR